MKVKMEQLKEYTGESGGCIDIDGDGVLTLLLSLINGETKPDDIKRSVMNTCLIKEITLAKLKQHNLNRMEAV